MGKTILELNASEAVITNPENYYFETHKQGDATSKKTVLTKITTYLATLFQEKFNASNTATGEFNVTINAKSGIATFTGIVGADTVPTVFSMENNFITTSSIIRFDLSYAAGGDEMCAIAAYVPLNGSVDIFFTNYSGINAEQDKIVSFQILN